MQREQDWSESRTRGKQCLSDDDWTWQRMGLLSFVIGWNDGLGTCRHVVAWGTYALPVV
jgi:hypothetical protein